VTQGNQTGLGRADAPKAKEDPGEMRGEEDPGDMQQGRGKYDRGAKKNPKVAGVGANTIMMTMSCHFPGILLRPTMAEITAEYPYDQGVHGSARPGLKNPWNVAASMYCRRGPGGPLGFGSAVVRSAGFDSVATFHDLVEELNEDSKDSIDVEHGNHKN